MTHDNPTAKIPKAFGQTLQLLPGVSVPPLLKQCEVIQKIDNWFSRRFGKFYL